MTQKLLISMLAAMLPFGAVAGTINFDDLALGNFDDIPSNYADHGSGGNGDARVGVSYSGADGTTNHLDFWTDLYGDLTKVAFTPTDGTVARITLTADPGWLISRISFDLAGWPDADLRASGSYGIGSFFDVFTDLLIEGDLNGPRRSQFSYTLAGGGQSAFMSWGTDWNVGIDNISFDVIADTNAVPLPGTLASAGLALLGLALRRRS